MTRSADEPHPGLARLVALTRRRSPPDLAELALEVARVEHPGLDLVGQLERVDRLGAEVERQAREEAGAPPTAAHLIAALRHVLFERHGFVGDVETYDAPANSYLNRVLDRQRGLPITLSVLTVAVARRAGLAAEGVGFPGHFLAKVRGAEEPAAGWVVLDPFHGGRVLDKAACRELLAEATRGVVRFSPELLDASTPLEIAVRMLRNLKAVHVREGDAARALATVERLAVLASNGLMELRDRGLLRLSLGRFRGAIVDLETYLTSLPGDAPDRGLVEAKLERAREGLWNLN